MRPRLTLLALAALASIALAAPAAPAAAQDATKPAGTAAAPIPWDAKPLGTYDLKVEDRSRTFGVTLTVADSAGTLTATFLQEGDSQARPMTIAVKGNDLTVASDMPRGRLEVVMQREAGDRIVGRWTITGGHAGTLEGKKRP